MPRHSRIVNHENINTMKELIDMQTVCGIPLFFDKENIKETIRFEIIKPDAVEHPYRDV